MIVKIHKYKGWKGKIFCAQGNNRKICPNDIDRAVVSEDIKYKDKEDSIAVIVGIQKLSHIYASSCNSYGKGIGDQNISVIFFYKVKNFFHAPDDQQAKKESKVHVALFGQKVLVLLDDGKDIDVEDIVFCVEAYIKEGLRNEAKN